ncbi:hypothetical protein BV96_01970 [Sphingomonas paucimobilis]|nr:hypothetical protein BV96_01970 [Sphingomonas paucimobilis]
MGSTRANIVMSDVLTGEISRMRGHPAVSVSPWILLVPPHEVPAPCAKPPPLWMARPLTDPLLFNRHWIV